MRDNAHSIYCILTHGLTLEAFTFGSMVTQKPQTSMQGLTKPLDYSTWLLLFMWTLTFVIYANLVRPISLKLTIVFIIWDQGQNVNYKRPVYWLCGSWYLLATVLSNAYKGEIFRNNFEPNISFGSSNYWSNFGLGISHSIFFSSCWLGSGYMEICSGEIDRLFNNRFLGWNTSSS